MSELNKLSEKEFLSFIVRAFSEREDLALLIGVVVPKSQNGTVHVMVETPELLDLMTGPEILRACATAVELAEARQGKLNLEIAKRPM